MILSCRAVRPAGAECPVPLPSDERLVRRARDGDRRAFDALVRRHELRVWRIARGVVGNDTDASDAAQETWIAVLRHLDTFAGEAQFTTWLHRIALTKAYDTIRARTRSAQPEDRVETQDLRDPFEQSLDRQALLAAIDGLDDSFRVALVLVDLCGASIQEAAEALQIAPGTVKSRVFRARAQLAAALGTIRPREPSEGHR